MNEKTENTETTMIEATIGPYAGQRLTMPTADAKAAIADGWARDPAQVPDENAPPSEPMTAEQRAAALEKAQAAAFKLRGEPLHKLPEDEKSEDETRAATAKPARGDYDTRAARSK